MQKKGGNISLSSYDDIFSTEESRTESTQERVQEIPLSQLHPFEGHPFKVVDDEAMMKTAESIAQFGVMTPAMAGFNKSLVGQAFCLFCLCNPSLKSTKNYSIYL